MLRPWYATSTRTLEPNIITTGSYTLHLGTPGRESTALNSKRTAFSTETPSSLDSVSRLTVCELCAALRESHELHLATC